LAIYYRGAGVGTWWHERDTRDQGLTPKNTDAAHSLDRLMHHIGRADYNNPHVSLTLSYGIACEYARLGRLAAPQQRPGYVYQVEISAPLPAGLQLLDPIKEIGGAVPPPPADIPYQHDGNFDFILGVIKPELRHLLSRPIAQSPPEGGTARSPNLSLQLETLLRTLRDAEVLALGTIPRDHVQDWYEVW